MAVVSALAIWAAGWTLVEIKTRAAPLPQLGGEWLGWGSGNLFVLVTVGGRRREGGRAALAASVWHAAFLKTCPPAWEAAVP